MQMNSRSRDVLQTVTRFLQRWMALLAPIILLLLWEALVRGDVRIGNLVLFRFEPVLPAAFFARPTEIVPELRKLYENGSLISDVWDSLVRVLAGFLLGAIPAVGFGLLMGSSGMVRALFSPLAEAFYAIPKIAILPLVLFIYGTGEDAMVRMVALSVCFLMLLSIYKGVIQIDPRHYEVARSFGASRLQMFFSVTLPASMPTIVTSMQLGMGFALVVIVGSEFLAGGSGIGNMIWEAKQSFLVVRMFAGLIVVGVMGYVLAVVLTRVGRLMLPWQSEPRQPEPTRFQQWLGQYWRATRPWSFTATYIPILVGSGVAGYQIASADGDSGNHFNFLYFGLALVGAVAFQAGTNLVNDYYDHIKGADNAESTGIGGSIQRGEFSPRFILMYGIACFALGAGIGIYLVSIAGTFILWLGIFSLLAGFLYTAGPVALGYIGLGEITVGVFMGPVIVIGANYVQTGSLRIEAVAASLPVALIVAAILHVNNIRDMQTDRIVGKRTLATLLGRENAIREYIVLVLGAYVLLVLTVLAGYVPPQTLIALLTLPSALALVYRVAARPDPLALNPVLRRTAQLHFRFGVLLAAGWFYAMVFRIVQI